MNSRANLPVSVVLVTWNSASTLRACLAGLASSFPPAAELVVVDNASEDETLAIVDELAAKAASSLVIVRNEGNSGFAAGANRGIERSSQPYVFLLNPDVRLLPGTLAALHHSLSLAPPDVAAAGGKLMRSAGNELIATNVVDSTGIIMTRNGRHFDRGAGEIDEGQYDFLGEVFGLTGAAVLFQKSALFESRIDGEVFDEDFFAFREDVDLAWRLRGFGFRALYDPDAVAFHRRMVVPERRRELSKIVNFHSVKNRFLLRIHHADRGWMLRCGWPSLLRDCLVAGACLTIEISSAPALLWVLRNFPKHFHRRREILSRRRATSKELLEWFSM